MSVRNEDRRENNCPSRGLGMAAAAIGVGVGAALNYSLNQRSEFPDCDGSTSGNWMCEQLQAFPAGRGPLERCSICLDVMLGDQQLMQLPCTHHFHAACIGPWLEEHLTCPMCRKSTIYKNCPLD